MDNNAPLFENAPYWDMQTPLGVYYPAGRCEASVVPRSKKGATPRDVPGTS